MKTTENLLNEVVGLGFDEDEALEIIDASLDEELGFENRKPIKEEELSDELYETMLLGFQCETEWK